MSAELKKLIKEVHDLYDSEKFKDVVSLLTDDVLQKFKDTELYAMKSQSISLSSEGFSEEALQLAEKAIEIDKKHFQGYVARGFVWYDKGNHDEALKDSNMVITLNPQSDVAYNLRGIAWSEKGDHDKAIEDYNKAIALNPEYVKAYNNRGNSWAGKGDLDKAIEDYNKAIALNPEYNTAYFGRGIAWSKKGDYDKAIENYNQAIALNPEYAKAYNNRGISWKEKGDYDKAIEDYNQAIALDPRYDDAYYNKGAALIITEADNLEVIDTFQRYLDVTHRKDDVWARRARNFIAESQEKIKNASLGEIDDITTEIKKVLLMSDGCVTHYTGISVAKILILEKQSKFRLSEGAFLNDTSEGTELFNFLEYKTAVFGDHEPIAKPFASQTVYRQLCC